MPKARHKRWLITALSLIGTAGLFTAVIADNAQHAPSRHSHGTSELNLVVEGSDLWIELRSPAADLLGFEHPPGNVAERAMAARTRETLEAGAALIVANAEAGCRLVDAEIESPLLETTDHDHGHPQTAHGGEHHADILASYHWQCSHPERLTHLTIDLFDAFSGVARVDAQFVTTQRQGAARLHADARSLRL